MSSPGQTGEQARRRGWRHHREASGCQLVGGRGISHDSKVVLKTKAPLSQQKVRGPEEKPQLCSGQNDGQRQFQMQVEGL